MSHLQLEQTNETTKLNLDLTKGFSWLAVLNITNQKHEGKKIIYEICQKNTPISLSIGLDEEDNLKIWLVDINKKNFSTRPIPKDTFLNRFILLSCKIVPKGSNFILKLSIKNGPQSQITISGNLGQNSEANFAIGANLNGKDNAAFDLAELIVYERNITEVEQLQLEKYIEEKYEI